MNAWSAFRRGLLVATAATAFAGCNTEDTLPPSTDWDVSFGETLPFDLAPALKGSGPADLLLQPWLQAPSTESMTVFVELPDAKTPAAVHIRRAGSDHRHRIVAMESTSDDGLIRMAKVDGLSSNAFYEYQVVLGKGHNVAKQTVTPRYFFRTWPAPGDNVTTNRVIAISDTQYNGGSDLNILRNIVEEGIMGNECDLADPITCTDALSGILISGDVVEIGSYRPAWRDEFFDRVKAISPYVPIIAAPGNHDYLLKNNLKLFSSYFEGTDNGTEGFKDQWYHLNLNGTAIVVLDSYPVSRFSGVFKQETLDKQRNWLRATLEGSDATMAVSIFHHGCLSELWLSGESIGSCEFVTEMERWTTSTNKISAHLFGHTHGYSRGQSRDAHHLWMNSASASGNLEPVDNLGHYDAELHDYDTFHVTRSEFGYSVLTLTQGPRPSMTLLRRQGGHTAGVAYPVVDEATLFIGDAPDAPVIEDPESTLVGPELVLSTTLDDLFEVHWQFSTSADFEGEIFDIWGNATRRENYFYERDNVEGSRDFGYTPIDFQEGVDIRRIQPKPLIDAGAVLAGDFDQWRRWTKLKAYTNSHLSPFDPWSGGSPAVLQVDTGDTLYYRARVRDSALNWSAWSSVASAQF